jgi:hypothetical protein
MTSLLGESSIKPVMGIEILPEATSFIGEVSRIIDAAEERNLTIRVMGAVAFRIHCTKSASLFEAMDRPLTDIDFMALRKQRLDIIKLFKDLGYNMDKEMLILSERLKFHNMSGPDVDVFLDELKMCHTLSFVKRLRLDSPTISLVDMLLEKMQIVEINEKDIKDTIILLREHDLGSDTTETIDIKYLSNLLSDDWGLYYTVTTNFRKVLRFLPKYDILSAEDLQLVSTRISRALDIIDASPKSLRWRMRAKIGTRSRWYDLVEEASPSTRM